MLVSSMDRLCFSLKTGGRLAREDLRNGGGGGGGSWGPSCELRGMSCAWSRCLDTNRIDKKTWQDLSFVHPLFGVVNSCVRI